MASKYVKSINSNYASRHTRKRAKGLGIYARGLPGTPNGLHVQAGSKEPCRCGGCSA